LTYAPCAVELAKSSARRILQGQKRPDLRKKPGHMRLCIAMHASSEVLTRALLP